MTRSTIRFLIHSLCWCVVGSPQLDAQGSEMQKLALEKYLDMESVSDPQISPDGSQIVYTRGWIDKVNDSRKSSLWIMNIDGSKSRQLLPGGGARWSPDGTRILFTKQGDPKGSQIFVRWMDDEGAVSQITRLENGPSNARWSPDGKWISFTSRFDDKADFAGVKLPTRPKGAKWTAEPKVVERASYKRDGVGYTDTGWTHLFVVPAEGGTARQLTDGAELYFSSYRTEDWDRPKNWQESDIYAVEVKTAEIRRLTKRRGPDGQPTPSPDGRIIAYIAGDEHKDTYRNSKIYVMNRDGSDARPISGDYDRQSGGMMWAPDGSGLYFNVSREGYRNLHFVSLDGGVKKLTEGNKLLSLSSLAKQGTAVGTISSAHEPGDIYRFPLTNPSDHDAPD